MYFICILFLNLILKTDGKLLPLADYRTVISQRLSQARYKSLEQRNVFPNKGQEPEQDEDKRGETDGREDWGGLGQAGWSNCG